MITGLIAGGALVLALVAWSIWLMRKGGKAALVDQREDELEAVNDAQQIRDDNRRLSHDELIRKLRSNDGVRDVSKDRGDGK